jgi:hypothetical protein
VTDSDDARLHALVHGGSDGPQSGFTVFWPARDAAAEFTSFFLKALPRVTEYRPEERRYAQLVGYDRDSADEQILDLRGHNNLSSFDFIRFEYNRIDLQQYKHPILVAWANLDAGVSGAVPIDSVGVLLQRGHIAPLEQLLATLIAQTSVEQPTLGSVVSLLAALNNYLNPKAAPMAHYG